MNDYATKLALWYSAIIGHREELELDFRATSDDLWIIVATPVKRFGQVYSRAQIMNLDMDIQEFAEREFHRMVRKLRGHHKL